MSANVTQKRHNPILTTDIMWQIVASRGHVAALPRWLAEAYAGKVAIRLVRLGQKGIGQIA
jgi:LysR family transcriptional regulator for metE and metH